MESDSDPRYLESVITQKTPGEPPKPPTDSKNCPYCCEPIKASATICKHCGASVKADNDRQADSESNEKRKSNKKKKNKQKAGKKSTSEKKNNGKPEKYVVIDVHSFIFLRSIAYTFTLCAIIATVFFGIDYSELRETINNSQSDVDRSLAKLEAANESHQALTRKIEKLQGDSESIQEDIDQKSAEFSDKIKEAEDRFANFQKEYKQIDVANQIRRLAASTSASLVSLDDLEIILKSSPEALAAIKNFQQPKPLIISPVSSSPGSVVTIFSSLTKLEWTKPVGYDDQGSYAIQISRDENFSGEIKQLDLGFDKSALESNVFDDFEVKIALNHFEFEPDDWGFGEFYWRVRSDPKDQSNGDVKPEFWSEVRSFEIYKDAMHRINTKKTIRVGVSPSETGRFAVRSNSGALDGIEIQIVEEIRNRFGESIGHEMAVEFKPYPWVQLFGAINRNEIDFAIATVSIREDRKQQYGILFSNKYYETQLSVVTKNNQSVNSIEDLRGKVLVGQERTTALAQALEISEKAESTLSGIEALKLVRDDQAFAAIIDHSIAENLLAKHGLAGEMKITKSQNIQGDWKDESYGVVIGKKEEELKGRIDYVLGAIENNGRLEEIRRTFSEDD